MMELGKNQPAVATVRPTPEVQRALLSLRDAVERYSNVATRFPEKLNCVMLAPPPPCEEDKRAREYSTNLANEIADVTTTIHAITSNLETMFERIEL